MVGHATTYVLRARTGLRPSALVFVSLLLAGCVESGIGVLSWGEAFGALVAFFIMFAALWIFIALFADIFRRDDLSGGMKAGWVLLMVVLPLLGALIYIVARPKPTVRDLPKQDEHTELSEADVVAQLNQLKAAGKISDADYEEEMRNIKT